MGRCVRQPAPLQNDLGEQGVHPERFGHTSWNTDPTRRLRDEPRDVFGRVAPRRQHVRMYHHGRRPRCDTGSQALFDGGRGELHVRHLDDGSRPRSFPNDRCNALQYRVCGGPTAPVVHEQDG